MSDIPNTEFITVKRDDKGRVGVFVGGKPSTQYRGQEIEEIELVKKYFVLLQKHNPQITEFHAGAFATVGEYAKVGNPDAKLGTNAWCRVVSKKSPVSDSWVFYMMDSSAAACARDCAHYCLGQMCANWKFRRDVFGLIDKKNSQPKQNALTNVLKDTDLSKLIGTHKIGAYEIVVRKSGQNTRG